MKNSKAIQRGASVVLAIVIMLQMLPLQAIAVSDVPVLAVDDSGQPVEIANDGRAERASIVGEDPDRREETQKHFRLSDGSYLAVEYGTPVHYYEDEEWADIDNTLVASEMDGRKVFMTNNGDNIAAFSADLENGQVLTTGTAEEQITLFFADGLPEEQLADSESADDTSTGQAQEAGTPEEAPVDARDEAAADAEESSEADPSDTMETEDPADGTNADETAQDSVHQESDEPEQPESEADTAEVEAAPETTSQEEPEPTETATPVQEISLADELCAFDATAEAKVVETDARTAGSASDHPWTTADLIPAMLQSRILYADVYPGVDIQYDLYGKSVKESIVLKEPRKELAAQLLRVNPKAHVTDALEDIPYTYTFLMELDGLTPKSQEDGSIVLFNGDDMPEYVIPAPFMEDAGGNISNQVSLTMEADENGYLLSITADNEWIEAEERVYPIVIDPTIAAYTSYMVGGTAAQNKSNSAILSYYGSSVMGVGYGNNGEGEMEAFFKLTQLPTIGPGVVVDATIEFAVSSYVPLTGSSSKATLLMHEVTSANSGTDWITNLTWANKPTYAQQAMDYATIPFMGYNYSETQYASWDITKCVQKWYADQNSNYGLALTSNQNTSSGAAIWFPSSGNTFYTVTYRDVTGIEGYYTYETQNIGRAGAGLVGDYSSFLTLSETDMTYSGTTVSFSLSHVYNSNLHGKNVTSGSDDLITTNNSSMLMGTGWQLSAQQSLVIKTIGSADYFVYRDGDGTHHYFVNIGGYFYDEDGLNLTLETLGTNMYQISDLDGNRKVFYNGYLLYEADGNDNKIFYLYNGNSYSYSGTGWYPPSSGARLTAVAYQTRGQTTASTICTFTYSSNYLTKVTDFANRVTTFNYNSAHRLTSIKHPDGTYAYYNYDTNGYLLSVYDGEGKYGVAYTYDSGGAVSTISEYTAASNTGTRTVGAQTRRSKNGAQETVYQYIGDDRSFDTSDDIFTRYAFDHAGRTINIVTHDYRTSGTSGIHLQDNSVLGVTAAAYTENTSGSSKNNRIEKTAETGIAGVNLLRYSGLESHDGFSSATNYWTKQVGYSENNAVVKTKAQDTSTLTHNGDAALKTFVSGNSPTSSQKYAGMYQTVSLTAGVTYTFSAYVNTSELGMIDNGGGAYVEFQTTSGEAKGTGPVVGYKTSASIDGGWQRVYCTYTAETTGNYRVAVKQSEATGIAYFDDLQLEVGNAPSSPSLIQNGHFQVSDSSATEWVDTNLYVYPETGNTDNNLGFLWGSTEGMKRGSQDVPINKLATETYLLSCWAYAYSAAQTASKLTTPENNTERYFGLIARCNYDDNTKEYFYMPFNDDCNSWQYASCVIVPKRENQTKTLVSITVITAYDYNINWCAFDNISLREEPCTTYTYDSKGNVTAVNATGNSEATMAYAAGTNKLTSSVTGDRGTYTYTYGDTTNSHLVTRIANDNVALNISYDSRGNSETTSLASTSNSSFRKITTAATYSPDGNQLLSQTGANGGTTTYTYSTQRNVETVTDSASNVTCFSYNTNNDRPMQSYQSGVISTSFTYTNGRLTSVVRGGYKPGTTTKQNQTYTMAYDSFGNMTGVQVGSRNLASYTYAAGNGNLLSMTYGNNDTVSYAYDNLGRVTGEYWGGNLKYQYFYNSEGRLSGKVDMDTQKAVYYEYDSLGRLIYSGQTDHGSYVQYTEHQYDTENRISHQAWTLGGANYSEDYTYRSSDGALTQVAGSYFNTAFGYDALKRLSYQYNYYFKQDYTYRNIDSTKTTTQVASIAYTARPGGTNFVPFTLAYTYDSRGNITSEKKTAGESETTTSYTYDGQGQLLTETRGGTTCTYTYDTYGNIRSVSGGESHTYTYGDSSWLDLLTAYDGQSIAYDAIGNPTSYYNGTRWAFSWANGRQLTHAVSSDQDITFTYGVDGIRDSKTVGNTTYSYLNQNGQVVRQTGGGNTIDFIYDEQSRPRAMVYNGVTYLYVLNLQGDVIRIISKTGETKAEYTYDAWGRILTATGDLAAVNPLRYRGYFYDTETGLYYLQSRYYDPTVKRFINADSYTSTNSNFIGYNMFAYCNNNPVVAKDSEGKWLNIVVGAVVGAAINVTFAIIEQQPIDEVIVSGLCGAAGGALTAAGFGAVAGAVTSLVDSGYGNIKSVASGSMSVGEAITGTVVDTALGTAFGAMGSTSAAERSMSSQIANNAVNGVKSLMKSTVHPTVKATAKKAIRRAARYAAKTALSEAWSGCLTSAFSIVYSKVVRKYYSHCVA